MEKQFISYLRNKHILLGITGGIAAYKSADLVRRLTESGAQVQVVMTRSATQFVTPLTFQALSTRTVYTDDSEHESNAAMLHIELARWADAILLAPCSANTIAKLATGNADNLLTSLCLASDIPIAIAPAMNRLMWSNPATQANASTLKSRGFIFHGPDSGDQACGDIGAGRMLEPVDLRAALAEMFSNARLAGKQFLITAGPTRESIDPVRFISNHSSGKMGFAIAQAAHEAGAHVTLVSGPVSLPTPDGIQRINVETAQEMLEKVMQEIRGVDVFISNAAVADYRVEAVSTQKIKKSSDQLNLSLIRNPDILATVSHLEQPPFTVGFAAETDNLEQHAKIKLKQKSLNVIAANKVDSSANIGFNSDNNELNIFWMSGKDLQKKSLTQKPKTKLARELINLIAGCLESVDNKNSQKESKSKLTS